MATAINECRTSGSRYAATRVRDHRSSCIKAVAAGFTQHDRHIADAPPVQLDGVGASTAAAAGTTPESAAAAAAAGLGVLMLGDRAADTGPSIERYKMVGLVNGRADGQMLVFGVWDGRRSLRA